MLKYIKKILAFLSIVLFYFIIKESLSMYVSLQEEEEESESMIIRTICSEGLYKEFSA